MRRIRSRLFSILAVCGVLVTGALLLRKKKQAETKGTTTEAEGDPRVEDFTPLQQALLQRVREIWAEYCSSPPALEVR
jgi:hypothetical protein